MPRAPGACVIPQRETFGLPPRNDTLFAAVTPLAHDFRRRGVIDVERRGAVDVDRLHVAVRRRRAAPRVVEELDIDRARPLRAEIAGQRDVLE